MKGVQNKLAKRQFRSFTKEVLYLSALRPLSAQTLLISKHTRQTNLGPTKVKVLAMVQYVPCQAPSPPPSLVHYHLVQFALHIDPKVLKPLAVSQLLIVCKHQIP